MSTLLRGLFRNAGICMAPADDGGGGGGGGGGGSGGGGGAPTPPAPRAPEPQTFSHEYVRELREENKGWRLKADEHKKAADDAKALVDKAAKEADEKIAAASKAANDRIIRAELKAAALKAGMVDLDGLKLADLSKIKINEQTGEVEGADALMEELKKGKPYLFGTPSSSSGAKAPPSTPPTAKKASEMTPEEYAAAKRQLTGAR